MRRAMAAAVVGDDVYGEDPTVRLLEEETAGLLGKEAALFVPSGCMGNQIAVAVHTKPGDEILCDRMSHIAQVEARTITEFLGCRFAPVDAERGLLTEADIERGFSDSGRSIRLLEIENTHNWHSGAVYSMGGLQAIAAQGRDRGVPVHLDGARLWNASVASEEPLDRLAGAAQSVMVCYSKGLGAPVGSAVAGTRAFIHEARARRKMFGGAMRQAGILAAGALHAVRHHRDRLIEDHRRARRLAEAIAETPGIRLDPATIRTNTIIADTGTSPQGVEAFVDAVAREGVLIQAFGGPRHFRAVLHLDVDDAGVAKAIAAIRSAAGSVLARA